MDVFFKNPGRIRDHHYSNPSSTSKLSGSDKKAKQVTRSVFNPQNVPRRKGSEDDIIKSFFKDKIVAVYISTDSEELSSSTLGKELQQKVNDFRRPTSWLGRAVQAFISLLTGKSHKIPLDELIHRVNKLANNRDSISSLQADSGLEVAAHFPITGQGFEITQDKISNIMKKTVDQLIELKKAPSRQRGSLKGRISQSPSSSASVATVARYTFSPSRR